MEFQHGLGEIVTALAEAGLRIDFVHEHDFDLFPRFELMQRQEDGMCRFPPGQPRVPMMFSLTGFPARPGLSLVWALAESGAAGGGAWRGRGEPGPTGFGASAGGRRYATG